MYLDRVLEISQAKNGFVLNVCIPLKKDAKASKSMLCCESSANKQYIAKDAAEVSDLVSDILPLLDKDYTTEQDFDKAFDEAVNDVETEEKE